MQKIKNFYSNPSFEKKLRTTDLINKIKKKILTIVN